MRLAIIGTGYVGLVSGACFSEFGHDVVCVDINEATIAKLQAGEIPIYEPGLDDLVRRNGRSGRLRFTSDIAEGVRGADAVFIDERPDLLFSFRIDRFFFDCRDFRDVQFLVFCGEAELQRRIFFRFRSAFRRQSGDVLKFKAAHARER